MHVVRFLSSNDENHLTVIEKNKSSCRQVSNQFDAVILNADVTKPGILEEGHPSEVDLLVAATDDDRTNTSLVHRAKMEYGIPRIVAVANSPKSKEQMKEAGADVVVSPVDLALKDLENVFSLDHSTTIMYRPDLELEVTEMTVPGDGSMMGKKLSDIKIPDKCRIVLVSRDSGYTFPDPDLELKPGDKLLILGDATSVHHTVELLTSTEAA
jgi:trk system potassium uptake protein TrkA